VVLTAPGLPDLALPGPVGAFSGMLLAMLVLMGGTSICWMLLRALMLAVMRAAAAAIGRSQY